VLLVGAHGTAKSMLAERIAKGLGLAFRHYNASLLNYDDLVGIPLPDESGQALRFVASPGAIWDAEFAFLDEISRCRADLQNKLFPLIHERRVAGVDLPRLRQRWAAMNPPASDDADLSSGSVYLGSEALDPALADRFAFVVRVPGWERLSDADRIRLIRGDASSEREDAGLPLAALVARCHAVLRDLERSSSDPIVDYVIGLVDLLGAAQLQQSPRRARQLAANVLAVHAARIVLEGEDVALGESAELALLHGLPQNAEDAPPELVKLIAAHRQAWEVAGLARDDAWRAVLRETDPVRRVSIADRGGLADEDVSRLVTQALGAQTCNARRIGLATVVFLAFRERRALTPAAWEPLAELSRRVLEPREQGEGVAPDPLLEAWREINQRLALKRGKNAITRRIERNFLLGGFPDLWRDTDWRAALDQFRADLELFEVEQP
jgi:MoxR-like ATPase